MTPACGCCLLHDEDRPITEWTVLIKLSGIEYLVILGGNVA